MRTSIACFPPPYRNCVYTEPFTHFLLCLLESVNPKTANPASELVSIRQRHSSHGPILHPLSSVALMARAVGFEPTPNGFGDRRSTIKLHPRGSHTPTHKSGAYDFVRRYYHCASGKALRLHHGPPGRNRTYARWIKSPLPFRLATEGWCPEQDSNLRTED